ncbi:MULTISPECIES: chemotaxis protein CheW [unclassified Sedimentibacter]|uniref:chemotaxis protein CheW n=1 Tax=unclassified Sedimentibacter TaxID=2649220 RepID=UPI0027DF4588|nr:chemotaxis protein CheW [Sedimentibacter sp. MB35-C1]WMJ77751.1 chemotaxis protein CheW [Sedimentibacter sp. MB35-C1]
MAEIKQIVVFKLGETDYGFPIEQVNEIIKYIPVSKIPNSSAYMEGTCNLRGKLHVILNLRSIVGLEISAAHDNAYIVIANNYDAGFIVDEVKMIVSISEEDIIDTDTLAKYIDDNYILYIIKYNNKLVNVLNLESITSRSLNNVKK